MECGAPAPLLRCTHTKTHPPPRHIRAQHCRAPCPQAPRVLSSSNGPTPPMRMNTTRYLLTNPLIHATLSRENPPSSSRSLPESQILTQSHSTHVRISRIFCHLRTPKIGRFATPTFQSTCALFKKTPGCTPNRSNLELASRPPRFGPSSSSVILDWTADKAPTARTCPSRRSPTAAGS
jgi:hypothetical protein